MAGAFTAIDLSLLSAPTVVESLDYETILAAMIADLVARDPVFTAMVESDPAYKILEVAAYRETLIRQRVNDAARGVMLAYAVGADLDQIGGNYNVARLVLDPGDPAAVPPVPPTMESDRDFRRRIQLSFEGFTTAGSEGSYTFHALAADPDVKDAQAVSPDPGEVTVYILSRTGDGEAPTELLNAVAAALNAEKVRPLTDLVTVTSAAITEYAITAELTVYPGPDAEVVRQAAADSATAYARAMHRIGYDITLSGVYAALHVPGVQQVILVSPSDSIEITDGEAAFCTAVTVTLAESTDV
jgi:phage-related baseplate assembly protein